MISTVTLKDILIGARQESSRMRHYFLGVEHLFVALLQVKQGLASNALEHSSLSSIYVIDAVRRRTGKGVERRFWAGIPHTPRANIVLGIAHDIALDAGRGQQVTDGDIFMAVLEEQDSIPIRILLQLGVDVTTLHKTASDIMAQGDVPSLSESDQSLFNKATESFGSFDIVSKLTDEYAKSIKYLLADKNQRYAFVKVGEASRILDEVQRYRQRLAMDNLQFPNVKMMNTVVEANSEQAATTFQIKNIIPIIKDMQPKQLIGWLKHQYLPRYAANTTGSQPEYRFQAWAEYDWLFPPVVTLEYIDPSEVTTEDNVMADYDIDSHSFQLDLSRVSLEDTVLINKLMVNYVSPDGNTIRLGLTQGSVGEAHNIQVHGPTLHKQAHYRGESVSSVFGRVSNTRLLAMQKALIQLDPDFDPLSERILVPNTKSTTVPNPLQHYEILLNRYVNGTRSKIQGNLHLDNIIPDAEYGFQLLDYAYMRNGHTLFDWAVFETSVLEHLIAPHLDDSWASVWEQLPTLAALEIKPDNNPAIELSQYIRDIVSHRLATPDQWDEYFTIFALVTLRGITSENLPINTRRLLFLVSAMTMQYIFD